MTTTLTQMILLYVMITLLLLSMAVLWWAVRRAPIGHEDETGFHVGEEQKAPAARPHKPAVTKARARQVA